MKNICLFLGLGFSVIFGSGCGEKKQAASPYVTQEVSVDGPTKTETSGRVKFQLREINQPNQYVIHISWPKDYKNVMIEDSGRKIFEAAANHREFSYTLRDRTPYDLRVFKAAEEGLNLVGQFTGVTPQDFVFSGTQQLERPTIVEAYRVFLAAGTKIQTNGFSLKVSAEKLYSENAEIFSFPKGQKAALEKVGRHGGALRVASKEAVGHLRVELRGEEGGDGIDGQSFTVRAPNGASGSAGAHDCARALGAIVRCWCTSSPGPGLPGIDGVDGNPGTNAGKGGNSGELFVEISNDLGFSVNAQLEAGTSGRPGHGGEGQEGGFGGAPGNPTSDSCGGSHPGQDGKRGKSGRDGIRPTDGVVEKKCISIGTSVRDCEK